MRRTKDEWTGIVERYRDSGLTVHRFCQAEGISDQSLRNWNTRLMSGSAPAHGFVEVHSAKGPLLDPPGNRHGLAIRFQDGTVIEVHPDTDRPTLGWVLTLMANRQ